MSVHSLLWNELLSHASGSLPVVSADRDHRHLERVSFTPAWRLEDGLNDPCRSLSSLGLSNYLL